MKHEGHGGVYAAMLSPRHEDEHIDIAMLRKLTQFLLAKGITSFALNGATGEFCLTTAEQLRSVLSTVREVSGGTARILCGVGAAGISRTMELIKVAESEQVAGLLLPMPYFFPYQQEDLELYCRRAAGATNLPVLLYNLPQFGSGLEKETVRRLILEVPNIVGIKDSSGSLEILRHLTEHRVDACRIVGNDSALAPALLEGVCDGVVSGVACVLPELILELYDLNLAQNPERYKALLNLLRAFIAKLDDFPTPWGLKWTAEARKVIEASFSQPVTVHRREQAAAMQQWLREQVPAILPAVSF